MSERPRKKANAWQAAGAVFWSFFGVRKRSDYDRDAIQLSPTQVIVAGIVGAILFIGILLAVVYFVTR